MTEAGLTPEECHPMRLHHHYRFPLYSSRRLLTWTECRPAYPRLGPRGARRSR